MQENEIVSEHLQFLGRPELVEQMIEDTQAIALNANFKN